MDQYMSSRTFIQEVHLCLYRIPDYHCYKLVDTFSWKQDNVVYFKLYSFDSVAVFS